LIAAILPLLVGLALLRGLFGKSDQEALAEVLIVRSVEIEHVNRLEHQRSPLLTAGSTAIVDRPRNGLGGSDGFSACNSGQAPEVC